MPHLRLAPLLTSAFTLALGAALVGCSAAAEDGTVTSGTSGGGNGQGGSVSSFAGGGGSSGSTTPPTIGSLTGRVFAPQGTIPISGALVYLSNTLPEPIPDGVYCDRCIELDDTIPHTLSNPDGTFQLNFYQEGMQYLVVQKGQFRKVRQVNMVQGAMQANPENTTMPKRMNKSAGDDVPKIIVQEGSFDSVEESLIELGLDADQVAVVGQAFTDYATLSQYHIALVPCSSCNGAGSTEANNIRQFVTAGGKYYVTDWSSGWLSNVYPGYVTFAETCSLSEYDTVATQMDPDLQAWLTAQGITNPSFDANWTYIGSLNPQQSTDIDDNPVTITPKEWLRGSEGVLTTSFDQQCGRVLFSTFHSETSDQLLPQELALMYVLLEVGVCVQPTVPE